MKRIKTLVNLFYTNFWFRLSTIFVGQLLICIILCIMINLFILLSKLILSYQLGIICLLIGLIAYSYMIARDIGNKNE